MKTDWKKIGVEIESITNDSESGGTEFANKAFERILGEDWIRHAVDMAISTKPGAELAMNCLRHISSEKAADYAYSIYKSDSDLENKRMAVWLIKHLAVIKSYAWIEEFLSDQNVIGYGIGVLDQLLWCEKIDYEDEKTRVDYLMDLAVKNSNGELKDNVDFIKGYLKKKQEME